MSMSLENLIALSQARTESLFDFYLKKAAMPAKSLQESMAYGVLNGGKRIRPLLVYAAGTVVGAEMENLDAAACAVELIHSYSLIHDDLPAMDNADLRRGKPACHKAYGEAMAILAGDALQAFVFQILASHPNQLSANQRLEMIAVLSEASGPFGMAAGQALDITIMDKNISAEKLLHLYQLKTGALLTASIKLGMLGIAELPPETRSALEKYAAYIGLAFQIQDDLLDIESETAILGKPQGLDIANNKMTYPTLMGVEATRKKVQNLTDLALDSIIGLGAKGDILKKLAEYLLRRKL
ncbi:MAG: polyprenyl synthetase family protein [Gammaproteobacteria bacterium]|nr:polyprenyl synthetase family protein [Gammaproteobacteria bacterium]